MKQLRDAAFIRGFSSQEKPSMIFSYCFENFQQLANSTKMCVKRRIYGTKSSRGQMTETPLRTCCKRVTWLWPKWSPYAEVRSSKEESPQHPHSRPQQYGRSCSYAQAQTTATFKTHMSGVWPPHTPRRSASMPSVQPDVYVLPQSWALCKGVLQ